MTLLDCVTHLWVRLAGWWTWWQAGVRVARRAAAAAAAHSDLAEGAWAPPGGRTGALQVAGPSVCSRGCTPPWSVRWGLQPQWGYMTKKMVFFMSYRPLASTSSIVVYYAKVFIQLYFSRLVLPGSLKSHSQLGSPLSAVGEQITVSCCSQSHLKPAMPRPYVERSLDKLLWEPERLNWPGSTVDCQIMWHVSVQLLCCCTF